jgi:pimeloyl-ACP methyl ester carboxylesterase
MSVQGYHPGNAEAEQLIAGVLNIRSRIPFRPVLRDDEFGALKMPVLLLLGEAESMYDPRSAAERARKLIPHIEAEIIPDAGHMLITDQPELAANHILRFLQHPQ